MNVRELLDTTPFTAVAIHTEAVISRAEYLLVTPNDGRSAVDKAADGWTGYVIHNIGGIFPANEVMLTITNQAGTYEVRWHGEDEVIGRTSELKHAEHFAYRVAARKPLGPVSVRVNVSEDLCDHDVNKLDQCWRCDARDEHELMHDC